MSLFRRRRYSDIETSISEHITETIKELMADGLTRKEAELAARRSFGNRTLISERSREVWQWPLLESFWADIRFAFRQLVKTPGFTVTAVITLALGIAVNATMFSLVSAFLLPKLPGQDAQHVFVLSSVDPNTSDFSDLNPVSAPNYLVWRDDTNVFSRVSASHEFQSAGLTINGQPEPVRYAATSPNYFEVLKVTPVLGRTFASGEDVPGHNHVMILSYSLWTGHFAADPHIVGHTVRLDRENYTIIGVMPENFHLLGFLPQLWTPLTLSAADEAADARQNRDLFVFARLAPGITMTEARSRLAAVARRTETEFPASERRWGASIRSLPDYLVRNFGIGKALTLLMITVSFILLIACANVAGLLLTRASRRQKELAIRLSIGASRLRIVRQLLTEGVVISVLGGIFGLLLAYFGIAIVRAGLSFDQTVAAVPVTLDRKVLLYALILSILSALLSALTPAIKSMRRDVNTDLKNESRTASADRSQNRLRSFLVMLEVALALFLLVGTSLLIRAISRLEYQELGFRTDHLLTATLTLDHAQYRDPDAQRLFATKLLNRLRQMPGVMNAALSSDIPGTSASDSQFIIRGQRENLANAPRTAKHVIVSPGYFAATRIRLLDGRTLAEFDGANTGRAVMVNEEFARRFLAPRNALGVQVKFFGKDQADAWSEIVGVAANIKTYSEDTRSDPEIYEPLAQHPIMSLCVLLHSAPPPETLIPSLRRAVSDLDGELPLRDVKTMQQAIERNRGGNPLFARILGSFALLALIMAAIGIYGMVAYSTSQRTHEIGIRMALGAGSSEILTMILREGFKIAVIGSAFGLLLALPLPHIFDAMFSGLHFGAPFLYPVVFAVTLCVALAATSIPAFRATHLDPTQSLRGQ